MAIFVRKNIIPSLGERNFPLGLLVVVRKNREGANKKTERKVRTAESKLTRLTLELAKEVFVSP